jgi:hypothetical protein
MTPSPLVDVAINVYGKPYQTAVTLLSLLKHSGTWIDRIYFIEERRQPEGTDLRPVLRLLGDRVTHYRPQFWFWVDDERKYGWAFRWSAVRRSIRYQYGWEKSDKPYLFVLHNDVLFDGDLVGRYLREIGSYAGVGPIGQCWNCPAFAAQVCEPSRYADYQPSRAELRALAEQYPAPRKSEYERVFPDHSWPLPECRLNEFAALLHLDSVRSLTMPLGAFYPFGMYGGFDTGVHWFHQMNRAGHRFRHVDLAPDAVHGWASEARSGHGSLFDTNRYQAEERAARARLNDEFNLDF